MTYVLKTIWVVGLLTALVACPVTPSLSSIQINPTAASVALNASQTFTATALDQNNTPLTGVTFTWNANPSGIVTLESTSATTASFHGVTTGTAKITVSAGGKTSNEVTLNVTQGSNPGNPSSFDLIDQAAASGQIDAETALEYKVFSSFKDSRLPSAFQGSDPVTDDTDILLEISAKIRDLSEKAQEILYPFLIPPAYKGSWLNPISSGATPNQPRAGIVRCVGEFALGLDSVTDPANHARIWFDANDPNSRQQADDLAFELDRIWVKLINGLGMKDPLPDGDLICNGGDAKLDIYLVDVGFAGISADYNGVAYYAGAFTCRQFPGYIMLRKTLHGAELNSVLAHELMHTSQFAYKTASCFSSYGWITEATATWVEDYVYPSLNFEQPFATNFFYSTEKSLEEIDAKGAPKLRQYGAYVFFQFLAHTISPDTIRKTWEATESIGDSLGAVNKAIEANGGFDKQWSEFAKDLWNQAPVDQKSFHNWDNLNYVPWLAADQPLSIDADLNGKPSLELKLKPDVPHLAINYYNFAFRKSDPASVSRNVLFYNPYTKLPKAHVQALWQLEDGSWTEEDWSAYKYVGFCRDAKKWRIKDLTIIISNSEWQDLGSKLPTDDPPRFLENNLGCWGFDAVTTENYKPAGITISSNLKYRSVGGSYPGSYTNPTEGLLRVMVVAPILSSGTVTYAQSYASGSCQTTFNPQTFNITGSLSNSQSLPFINYSLEAMPDVLRPSQLKLTGTEDRAYVIEGQSPFAIANGTKTCPNKTTSESNPVGIWLNTNHKLGSIAKALDDGHLKGTYTVPSTSDSWVYTWDFTPVREP